MKASFGLSRFIASSLTAQIRAAEQQVLNRRQQVGVRSAALFRKIHTNLTAPGSLFLAGGIGFIIGELTQRHTLEFRGATHKLNGYVSTSLRTAMNFVTAAHTLYTAVPLARLMKSLRPSAAKQDYPATGAHHCPVGGRPDSSPIQSTKIGSELFIRRPIR